MGIRLNPPAGRPDDPYTKERQKVRSGSNSENLILKEVPLLLVICII